MKKANKLNFSSKTKTNSKRFKSFIISFIAFVIILGSVSLLMFMKSLDFDLNNLVSSSDELTTEETTESTTAPVVMEGSSEIVVICNNTDGEVSFAYLISTDMEKQLISVSTIPTEIQSSYNNSTSSLNEHYKKSGAVAFVKAFESYSGVKVDRYINIGELQFKNFASKFKDIVVEIPAPTDPKSFGGLSLNAGAQSLSADMLLKYIKYCDNQQKSVAFTALLNMVFDDSHVNTIDRLFEYIANNSQTDITIIDFTNEKDKIANFINNEGNIQSVGEYTTVGENSER